MNENIMRLAGFGDWPDKHKAGICPACDKPVTELDLRDALSRHEFRISGMCQQCQDGFFNHQPED